MSTDKMQRLLSRLRNAKVQLMLISLLVLAGVLLLGQYFIDTRSALDSLLRVLPVKVLADACIVAFLVGGTFEWKVRQETEERIGTLFAGELDQRNQILIDHTTQTISEAVSRVESAFATTMRGKAIHSEDEFFDQMEAHVIGAAKRVDLTYFDNLPPAKARTARGLAYYKILEAVIKNKRRVHFRRIIRANEAMWPRIEELMERERDNPNSSIACLIDRQPDRECIEAVTVQLVDDETTFLVSLGTQKNSHGPRDMLIKSREFCTMWTRYYDQMWAASILIVDRGAVLPSSWMKVKAATARRTPKRLDVRPNNAGPNGLLDQQTDRSPALRA